MSSNEIYIGILGVTLVILLLVGGVVFSVIVSYKQRLAQNIQISKLELAYEKELRDAELEVREQLMNYFSREIHDNVGHTLTYMRLLIENKKIDDPSLVSVFTPIEKYLVQASEQLRMLSRSLNSEFVQQLDLYEAIALEVDRLKIISKKSIQFNVGESNSSLEIDKNQQLMAFRIFQEIINNAIKHSAANTVTIRFNFDTYLVQVEDDGCGFQLDQVNYSKKASGLNNMIKRASLAQMNLHIESNIDKGTKLTLSLKNTVNHDA